MIFIILLTLALFILPFWFALKIVDVCIKKSNALRPIGILVSLLMAGILIVWGYVFVTEDYDLSAKIGWSGWLGMALGVVLAILGTRRSLIRTRKEIKLEEHEEKLEKENQKQQEKWAKEEAKKILEQGEISNYGQLDTILSILDNPKSGFKASNLSCDLEILKRKLEKEGKLARTKEPPLNLPP